MTSMRMLKYVLIEVSLTETKTWRYSKMDTWHPRTTTASTSPTTPTTDDTVRLAIEQLSITPVTLYERYKTGFRLNTRGDLWLLDLVVILVDREVYALIEAALAAQTTDPDKVATNAAALACLCIEPDENGVFDPRLNVVAQVALLVLITAKVQPRRHDDCC
jgi:hypothetical protein